MGAILPVLSGKGVVGMRYAFVKGLKLARRNVSGTAYT